MLVPEQSRRRVDKEKSKGLALLEFVLDCHVLNHGKAVDIIRFLRGYLAKSEYITNTKCCISSSRRRYTLTRDEIQGQFFVLDDIPTPSDDIPSLRLG